jgi:hypothetical protein
MNCKRVIVGAIALAFTQTGDPAMLVAQVSATCATSSQARALDYWVGDWSVSSGGKANSGQSRVSLSLDKCLVTEDWGSNTSSHDGQNALAYDALDRKWYGLFVDNDGRVHPLSGSVNAGVADLRGPSVEPDGSTTLNRVRILQISADRVEQSWEKSADKGKSWTMVFRMDYSRRKS